MPSKTKSPSKHSADSQTFNPHLRKVLFQVEAGSLDALDDLFSHILDAHKRNSRNGLPEITHSLLRRLEVVTTEPELRLVFDRLSSTLSTASMDEGLGHILWSNSHILVAAAERYIHAATLLSHSEDREASVEWRAIVPPAQCIYYLTTYYLHPPNPTALFNPPAPAEFFRNITKLVIRIWLFYARTWHLIAKPDYEGFSRISTTFSQLRYENDMRPPGATDSAIAEMSVHLGADDVVPICVGLLEHFRRSKHGTPPDVILAVLASLHIMHDSIPEQKDRAYRNGRLVPALTIILRKTLLSLPRRHCQMEEVNVSLASQLCLVLNLMALKNPLHSIRVPQALNCGLWSVCRRIFVLGSCKCDRQVSCQRRVSSTAGSDNVDEPKMVCPWSAEGFVRSSRLSSFPEKVTKFIVDLLLKGRLSTFRQLEKGMRRAAFDEAKTPGTLPYTESWQWEDDLLTMCLLLEKRHEYNESLRVHLCEVFDCKKEVYPKDLLICSGCLAQYYCSATCQKRDWKEFHWFECHLPSHCKYPAARSMVDHDFVDWLHEEYPELTEGAYGVVPDAESDRCSSPEPDSDESDEDWNPVDNESDGFGDDKAGWDDLRSGLGAKPVLQGFTSTGGIGQELRLQERVLQIG